MLFCGVPKNTPSCTSLSGDINVCVVGELIPEDEQPHGLLSGKQITEILFVRALKLKKIYMSGFDLFFILVDDCNEVTD